MSCSKNCVLVISIFFPKKSDFLATKVPKILCKGFYKELPAIIMQLCGPSLDKISLILKSQFSYPCICLIAIKAISILETVHQRGILHCSLSPRKFLVSTSITSSELYLVDFKYSKKVNYGICESKILTFRCLCTWRRLRPQRKKRDHRVQ